MTPEHIVKQIEAAFDGISRAGFDNWHGITPSNLERFRVDPREISVADDEGGEKAMWLVVDGFAAGYGIAFLPGSGEWAVVERNESGAEPLFNLVIQAPSLRSALDGM